VLIGALKGGVMAAPKSGARKFVSVNPGKCTGCGICEYACSLEKEGFPDPLKSRIRVLRLNRLLNITMACRFCEAAPCVKACPRDALKQSADGVLIVDEGKCDACGWCVQACPYGGIVLHPDKGVVVACDLCGGEPKCIEFCPEEALELVPSDEASEELWSSAIEKIPAEAEKLSKQISNKDWVPMFAEAEEKVEKLEKKLESIKEKEKTSKHS